MKKSIVEESKYKRKAERQRGTERVTKREKLRETGQIMKRNNSAAEVT